MIKKFLLASVAVLASPAVAQTFPVPSDVAAVYGPTGWSQVIPQFKTDSSENIEIDPTVTPMPVTQFANIPIPSTTNRIATTASGGANFKLTTFSGGTADTAKFRTVVDFSHMLPDDPVRNFGQPGGSHLHCFFGSGSANAYSTYKTLRQHSIDSTSAGTDANATAYWYPCLISVNRDGDGKDYAIKPDSITVYYEGNPVDLQHGAFIPRGLRYILGFDMDATSPTTQNAWLQPYVTAANSAYGSTRYSLVDPAGNYPSRVHYSCDGATPSLANTIKNSDGTDPFGGTCASGATFHMRVTGPRCYDGKNLWSPGGYKNVINPIWDNLKSKWACPYNYYALPELTVQVDFTQYGWTDRQKWDLSSDISFRAARGLTAAQVPAGTTFHTDWFGAWDDDIMRIWEAQCIGVEHNTPHECNSSQISDTQALIASDIGAGGRSPQVDSSSVPHATSSDPGWVPIPPAWSGAMTNMHIHN